MGDHYEVIGLGDGIYIEYQNEESDWNTKVIKLTEEQAQRLETLEERHYEEKQNLIKLMVDPKCPNETLTEIGKLLSTEELDNLKRLMVEGWLKRDDMKATYSLNKNPSNE